MELTRESIFISAVRSFCVCFASIIGIIIGIVLIFFILMQFSTPDIFPKKSDLTVAADAEGNRNLISTSAPVILRIDIRGVIGTGDYTEDKFTNMLLDSREGMLAHDRVKAIFLYMDTPGGTVTDSDGIYRALMEYKKRYQVPIYAFVDGLCASGGMYITSAADKIFATSSSVIGSVGVIVGPMFNVSELMNKYGVHAINITAGKDKDALSPFRPWKEGEDASLRAITDALYQQFVSIVAAARPGLDKNKLMNTYGAQIYDAPTALEYGYIDGADSSYSSTLAALAGAAQLQEHQYQVMQISPPHAFLSDFASEKLELLRGKVTHTLRFGPYMDTELGGRFLYMYNPLN